MSFRKIVFSFFFLIVFGLLSACAGMNGSSSSYTQQEQTEAKIKELEAQNKALAQQLESVQASVQSLNEKVGAMQTRMKAIKKAHKPTAHKTKHHKPKKNRKGAHKTAMPSKKTIKNKTTTSEKKSTIPPLKLYHDAYQEYAANKFKEAADTFLEFVKMYPTHPYANNALYWTGESYYSLGDYERAAQYFKEVVEKYPKGSKVPDALLKLGYTYAELDQKKTARDYLFKLMMNFPLVKLPRKPRRNLTNSTDLSSNFLKKILNT
jgi:tol-pal system protein YbgF